MKRIAVLMMMACVVLATPSLAVWIYDGTDVWVSEPESYDDPCGTWWYSWDGDGTVDADAFNLDASGWTRGECGVFLSPIAGHPLWQGASVYSYVRGRSRYHWEPGGSKELQVWVTTLVYDGSLTYDGGAIDGTHVSEVAACSGTEAYASGSVIGSIDSDSFYAWGEGQGYAITQSGSGADNDWGNVIVDTNDTDSWFPPPFLYNQGYDGELGFAGSASDSFQVNVEQDEFQIEAKVGGTCVAVVDITINDPNYYNLRGDAEAIYYINAETQVDLFGNIQ